MCHLITDTWWDILNFFMAQRWSAFLWIFQKNCKLRRGRDSSTSSLLMWYNTHAFWRTTSNIELLNKRGSPPYFHSDNNLVFGNALVHPFEKNTVQDVTVELIWLLFLKILSFNFLQTLSKSLRFRKFRRSNVHHFVVVQTNYFQVTLLFYLMCAFQSVYVPFFAAVCPQQ